MGLFVGVAGDEVHAVDDAGTPVGRASRGLAGLAELVGEVAVVAVADPDLAAGLAAEHGWTSTATTRGSTQWPVCLTVEDAGRGAAYCAELAWLWHHQPERVTVQGDRLGAHRVVAVEDVAAELVVSVDPASYDAVRAAIARLAGVREVR